MFSTVTAKSHLVPRVIVENEATVEVAVTAAHSLSSASISALVIHKLIVKGAVHVGAVQFNVTTSSNSCLLVDHFSTVNALSTVISVLVTIALYSLPAIINLAVLIMFAKLVTFQFWLKLIVFTNTSELFQASNVHLATTNSFPALTTYVAAGNDFLFNDNVAHFTSTSFENIKADTMLLLIAAHS
ncbi:hypothetical protein J5751_05710 [bacterium]|nr:hypothetical protein [bacterium]